MKPIVFLVGGMVLMAQGAAGETPLRIGIFGIVDQVVPLVVADNPITNDESLPVLSALGPDQRIAIGDTVAVRAVFEKGQLRAERILQVYAVAGPITARDGHEMTVLGTPAHVPSDVDPKVGQWVALSGLWSGDKVITTGVHASEAGGLAQVSGVFRVPDAVDTFRIGRTAVAGVEPPQGDFDDAVWTLAGVPDGAGLRVHTMARGVFGGPVDLEIWEGYASGPVASETWMIHGTGIYGYDREADMPEPGTQLRVCSVQGKVLRTAPADAPLTLGAAMIALSCG